MKRKDKSKILLINPSQFYAYLHRRPSISIPLGLIYIYRALKDDWQTNFLDCIGGKDVEIGTYLDDSETVKRKEGYYIGLSYDQIEEKLKTMERPEFVGISNSFFSTTFQTSKRIARIVKKIWPETKIILGGSGMLSLEEVDYSEFDYLIFGEGEEDIRNIVENLPAEKIQRNQTFSKYGCFDDELCLDLINFEKYFEHNMAGMASRFSYEFNAASFITSRGCPFKCSFCIISLYAGRGWRPHSLDFLMNLAARYKEHGVKHLYIEDDNFTLDVKRYIEIIKGFKRLGLSWDPSNGMIVEKFDKKTLEVTKENNCTQIKVAPESGSEWVLREVIGKKVSLEKIKQVIRWACEFDLPVVGFLVIGFPQEKKDDVKKTLDFALEYKEKYGVRWTVCYANPLPGTQLYEYCKQNNLLINNSFQTIFSSCYKEVYNIRHKELSLEYLREVKDKVQSKFITIKK